MKKPLVVLTGATSVGKSNLSIRLAQKLNGEIISADSIQVYRYMNIGSAKLKPEEMQGVVHHLIDVLNPDEDFNVVRFKEMALTSMESIYAKNKIPIIVGGTGFYIQALLYDIDFSDMAEDISFRRELDEMLMNNGKIYMHELLFQIDPESAAKIHYNNSRRVLRALEYNRMTGKKISEHNSDQHARLSPYNFAYFVLNRPREILYQNINQRVDQMIENGLKEEVASLLKMGYERNLISMQGVGYKEMAAHLAGEAGFAETVETIKKNTRHFAKRQITWFKREKKVTWLNYEDFNNEQDEVLEFIMNTLHNEEIV